MCFCFQYVPAELYSLVLPETYIGTDFLTRHVRRWLISDTDEDGLKDGEEVWLEVKYSPDGNYATVVGHLVSDPTKKDSDGDGIPDDEDTLPLEKGIYGGFVGELSIVSSNGHSFLIYKSYIDEILNFQEFSNVYGRGITGDIIQLTDRNYHINPNHYLTVSASSNSASDAYLNSYYDLIVTTYNNNSPMTNGGIKCNWEINNYYYDTDDNQLPNSSLTVPINEIQLQSLIDYWNANSYYSVLNHNCTTIAIYSWYRVSGIRFIMDICLPIHLKQQIEFNGGSEIKLSDILPYVD